jgi:hypothetical protein
MEPILRDTAEYKILAARFARLMRIKKLKGLTDDQQVELLRISEQMTRADLNYKPVEE